VLDESCRQLSAWRRAGIGGLRMAVNLSAHQLRAKNLVRRVADALERHGLAGGDLELEITESAAMENPERAIEQLHALRALGVALAIDDFGTGYSSLAYLKRLPIQVLKLDRTFVRDIEIDQSDADISAASLALARNLGLKVVAEGVETPGQRDFLVRHGCDYLQGYLYSKPLPAEGAERFIRAHPPAPA
jgi:EAL domain-containing protein (putative c-di-GMP-specific phosphodiesterase class I)